MRFPLILRGLASTPYIWIDHSMIMRTFFVPTPLLLTIFVVSLPCLARENRKGHGLKSVPYVVLILL